MVKIPTQLKKENLRFLLIKRGEKRPFEQRWTEDVNYRFDDEKLKKHIKNDGNYGVLTGFGDLLVIDCDVPEVVNEIKKKLPETLTVQTGSCGVHFYYLCPDFKKKIIMQIGKVHYGECQWKGQQIVGPGSLHPNQNTYEVINNNDIAIVTKDAVEGAISPFTEKKIDWDEYQPTKFISNTTLSGWPKGLQQR